MNKKNLLVMLFIFLFGLVFTKPVFALSINKPKITGVSYVNSTSVKINFNTNNVNSNYRVQLYNMTLGRFETTSIVNNSYTFTGLTTGKTYNVIMRVYYNTNVSDWSNTISMTPKLGVPVIDNITKDSTNSLTLYYNANDNPKGVEIYNYNTKKSIKTTNLKKYTITGLESGVTYSFIMRNYYDNNSYGGWSSKKSEMTLGNDLTVPTKVKNLSVLSKTSTSSRLTWAEQNNVSSYSVCYKKNSASSYNCSQTSSNSCLITGLSANTKYDFKVRAKNSLGNGSYSSVLSFSTYRPEKYYYYLSSDSERNIYNQLYNGINNMSKSISIIPVSYARFGDILNSVYYDNPNLFWYTGNVSYYLDKNRKVYKIVPKYSFTSSNINSAKTKFNNAVNKLVSEAKMYNNDYDREKYLAYTFANTVIYDVNSSLNQSAYSALVNKKTVCAGYSKAFQYVMNKLSIPTYYVAGYAGEPHAWNLVKLKDGYYNVDITWMRSCNKITGACTVKNTYFNLDNSTFSKTHTIRQDISYRPPVAQGNTYLGWND